MLVELPLGRPVVALGVRRGRIYVRRRDSERHLSRTATKKKVKNKCVLPRGERDVVAMMYTCSATVCILCELTNRHSSRPRKMKNSDQVVPWAGLVWRGPVQAALSFHF